MIRDRFEQENLLGNPVRCRMGIMKNPANKRAIIYLRVSTARQASTGGETEGYSIPAQRQACRRKAEELGADVVQEYVDAGAQPARWTVRPCKSYSIG